MAIKKPILIYGTKLRSTNRKTTISPVPDLGSNSISVVHISIHLLCTYASFSPIRYLADTPRHVRIGPSIPITRKRRKDRALVVDKRLLVTKQQLLVTKQRSFLDPDPADLHFCTALNFIPSKVGDGSEISSWSLSEGP